VFLSLFSIFSSNLFIHSIDENPSEIPENDQNLKALLCLLRGDLDKIELVLDFPMNFL